MKQYTVDYAPGTLKFLQKMDKHESALIYAWIDKNLEGCNNPRIHGKPLSANRAGQWRYRVGNYRLIAEIHDDVVTIFMVAIGHRSEIYH